MTRALPSPFRSRALPGRFRVPAVAVLSALFASALNPTTEHVFPGATWATKTPAEVGLDPARLQVLSHYVGGHGCVVRYGYIVFTWGDPARRIDVASAVKPIFTHFVFAAIERGLLRGVDERVVQFEPRLEALNPSLGHKDRSMTFRHLANQTACYGLSETPGTAFAYNDWQMALFFDTLFGKVFRVEGSDVDSRILHALLTDPIQCEDNPTFYAFGAEGIAGRLRMSPRDFARIGLLYLRHGNWNGRQILSKEAVRSITTEPLPNSIPRTKRQAAEMVPGQRSLGSRAVPDDQTDHLGSYSWLWWTNGVDREGKRHWPDVPIDVYAASGHGGKRMLIVFPSQEMVVSWNDTIVDSREKQNEGLKMAVTH